MIDEGYIKYQCYWQQEKAIAESDILELNRWRQRLYQLGVIGEYDNCIGFGNLSTRIANSRQMIISGTQTGGIPNLAAQHYSKVTDYSWQENYVTCQGLVKASSEALTHAAIYQALPEVRAVIHIHHLALWSQLLNQVPTTDSDIAYGTPEMADEIIRLCQLPTTKTQRIIAMSGHESGILTWGHDLDQAGEALMKYLVTV